MTNGLVTDVEALRSETERLDAEAETLRTYRQARHRRDSERRWLLQDLRERWAAISGLRWTPSDAFLLQLLADYDPEIVTAAVEDVSGKVGSGYLSGTLRSRGWSRYLWTVTNTLAVQRGYVTEPEIDEDDD